jgi:hypothetical protein
MFRSKLIVWSFRYGKFVGRVRNLRRQVLLSAISHVERKVEGEMEQHHRNEIHLMAQGMRKLREDRARKNS